MQSCKYSTGNFLSKAISFFHHSISFLQVSFLNDQKAMHDHHIHAEKIKVLFLGEGSFYSWSKKKKETNKQKKNSLLLLLIHIE